MLHVIKTKHSVIHLTLANIYKYRGLIFEYHNYMGATRCNKNLEPSNKPLGRKGYKIINDWMKLPPSKRKRTQIYG